jgi:hypothetical protein
LRCVPPFFPRKGGILFFNRDARAWRAIESAAHADGRRYRWDFTDCIYVRDGKLQNLKVASRREAGGVTGAAYVAALAGIEKVLAFDIGGTSTDEALRSAESGITNHTQWEKARIAGKCSFFADAGAILRVETPGNGGWGEPSSKKAKRKK